MTFFEEIKQQPQALRALAEAYASPECAAAKALAGMLGRQKYKKYIFTGMGSSYYAGYIASSILHRAGLDAQAFETREYLMSGLLPLAQDTLLVVISQSGESQEVVELMGKLTDDRNVVTLTNYEDRMLHQRGEARFLLYAGEEFTTASKSYTNTVGAVLYIAKLICDPLLGFVQGYRGALLDCAGQMERWIEDASFSQRLADFFHDTVFLCLVGGGASYCTASHGELVVEEAGKMFSSRYLPAQFIHGPIERIDNQFHAVLFDFDGATHETIRRIIDNLLTYGGRALVIGNQEIPRVEGRLFPVRADVEAAEYAPLLEVIPLELLVNRLGLQRGLTPGILTRVRK